MEGGDAGGMLEGEGEGFFVAVYGEVIGAFAGAGEAGLFRVWGVGRAPGACVVAADGVLDFDYLRSGGLSVNGSLYGPNVSLCMLETPNSRVEKYGYGMVNLPQVSQNLRTIRLRFQSALVQFHSTTLSIAQLRRDTYPSQHPRHIKHPNPLQR